MLHLARRSSNQRKPPARFAASGRRWRGKKGTRLPPFYRCLRASSWNDGELPGQPVLEIGRCFEDIHAGLIGFRDGLDVCVFASRRTTSEERLINWEFRGKFRDLFAHALLDLCLADVREDFRDPGADLLHLGLAHAACGDGRAAQADSATFHGRERIEWY